MPSALDTLPKSLQGSTAAAKLAKQVDNKSQMVKVLKGQLEEASANPSKIARAFGSLTGAGMAGVATGFTKNKNAKIAIAGGLGLVGVIGGAVIDSNFVYDAGLGAGAYGTGLLADTGIEMAVEKLKATASQLTAQAQAA